MGYPYPIFLLMCFLGPYKWLTRGRGEIIGLVRLEQ